jgi:ABC-2 type transport system ATP-binding protein
MTQSTSLLEVRALSVRRGARRVVDDVSFEVNESEIVAVLGPNGAGKSTLLATIVGAHRAERGEVRVRGEPRTSLVDRTRVFAYTPEDAELPSEVPVSVILAHAIRYGSTPASLASELSDAFGLGPLRDARPGELSRGERRRVSLFLSLCATRPVIVLDEPFSVFDPLQLADVLTVVRKRASGGVAILASVHQMSDAEKIADRVLLLREGRVVAFGSLDALRVRASVGASASLEQVFVALLTESSRAPA